MNDNKDVLMELAKQLISEDEIKRAIRSIISERVNYHVEESIRSIVTDILKEKSNGYIEGMVNDALSRPIRKDDGWGSVERYESFDEFVKDQIKKKSFDRSQWDIQGEIRSAVDKKIRTVAEKLAKQEAKDRSAAILKELAEEYDGKIS